jgi:hypothetical protein
MSCDRIESLIFAQAYWNPIHLFEYLGWMLRAFGQLVIPNNSSAEDSPRTKFPYGLI